MDVGMQDMRTYGLRVYLVQKLEHQLQDVSIPQSQLLV